MGADKSAKNTPNAPPKLFAQAQKFGILMKKRSVMLSTSKTRLNNLFKGLYQ